LADITITREDAALRILDFANEGRLVQSAWHTADADGRELACLLGAIHPSVNGAEDCPSSVMPSWMAELLPTLFDGVSEAKATDYGRRFAQALRIGNADDTVLRMFLIAAVEFAVSAAAPKGDVPDYWPAVEQSCAGVLALLKKSNPNEKDRAAAKATSGAWAAAEAARPAGAAAGAAAKAAAKAASGAWAASGAVWAVSAAAGAAAKAAAKAATLDAWAASGAVSGAARAAAEAAEAAEAAAYEHLFDALIGAMLHGVIGEVKS
jgi:hypothetical protein